MKNKSSLLVNFKKLGNYLSKQSTILIDARPEREYNEDHILDAINIDIFNYFIYTSNTEIKNHITELTTLFGKHGLKGTEKIVVYDNLISYYAPRLFWILEYCYFWFLIVCFLGISYLSLIHNFLVIIINC